MDSNNRNNRNGGNKKNNKNLRSVISLIGWALVLTLVFNYILAATSGGRSFEVPYSEMMDLVEQDQIKEIQLKDGVLYATPVDGYTYTEKTDNKYREPKTYTQSEKSKLTLYTTYLTDTRLLPLLDEHNVEYSSPVKSSWSVLGDILVMYILPMVLMIGLFLLVMRIASKNGGGIGGIGNVGKSNAKVYMEKQTGVTFKDVAGQDEAKESLQEIIDFLHNPQKYTAIGAKLPKGALLVGAPGTGKTLLAKAVAGEANVPFLSISGSDFVEMFVGVGASRVRDLFEQAKQKAPCIVFIDEIDAIGRARGKNAGFSGNDERENTLNQLLTEMDGFQTNTGVIVLAATNRVDILDKALTRAGRFDRQIEVGLPDVNERKEIFDVHLRPLRLDPQLDRSFLARQTPGFSGADIANVCNEAALIAARHNKKFVSREDFLAAIDRIVGGLEKPNMPMTPEERRITAIHEAGHAVVMWSLSQCDPVLKVTVVPRGRSLGATWSSPDEDRIHVTNEALAERLAGLLGGRIAEEVNYRTLGVGALNDLERATKMAYAMVTYYGMSRKIGPISYYDSTGTRDTFTKPFSEQTARDIDEEVRRIVEEAYARARGIIEAKNAQINAIADLLLEKETIYSEDLELILGPAAQKPRDTQSKADKSSDGAVKESDASSEQGAAAPAEGAAEGSATAAADRSASAPHAAEAADGGAGKPSEH